MKVSNRVDYCDAIKCVYRDICDESCRDYEGERQRSCSDAEKQTKNDRNTTVIRPQRRNGDSIEYTNE